METEILEQVELPLDPIPSDEASGESVAEPALEEAESEETVDYAALASEDLLAVRRLCPDLGHLQSLGELPDARRFGELRELGLSVEETLGALGMIGRSHDSRSHLRTAVPRRLGDGGVRMSPFELESAKRLFPGLGEREITRLYRRVSE